MRRFPFVLIGAAGLVTATVGLASPAQATPTTFTTRAVGANEVPASASAGAGGVIITADSVTNQVCIDATNVTGLDPVTLSHIHKQVAGMNGPVVVNFNGLLNTCVAADPTTVAEILAGPAGFYVNLHTDASPGGAIRGQLAAPKYTRLQAAVSGAKEVPPNASTATGIVLVDLDPASGQICVDGNSVSIGAIVNHHIHAGVTGVSGAIKVNFNGLKSTCVFSTPTIVAGIIAAPAGFYINMHTEAFQGGEVRGQLEALPTTTTTTVAPTTTTTAAPTTTTTAAPTTTTTTAAPTTTTTQPATPPEPVAVQPAFVG